MAHLIYRWLGILLVSLLLTACGAPNYAPVRDAAPTSTNSDVDTPISTATSTPVYSPTSFDTPYTEPVLVDSVFTPAEPVEANEDVSPPPPTLAPAPAENVIAEKPAEPTPVTAAPTAPPAPVASASIMSPDAGKSTWIWPSPGKVIRGFSNQNKGLDIQGNRGDPVYASADGEVVYSGTGLRGYGQLVIVKHNADYVSAYAHNSAVLVEEGDRVKQGQKIAEIGDSGTDSVKLYFELRYRGKPVDPIKYLPKR